VRHADGSLWYTGRFDGDGRPVGRHHVYFPGRLASLPADPQNPPPEAVSETLDFTRAGEPALDAAWRPQTPPWRPAGLTGDWRVHGPDGRPVSAGTYEEGRGHGTLSSWDAEGMLAETSFERGVAEGPARGFYPDDRLAWTGQHRRGLREGAWTVYSPDGEKLSIDHYGAGRQNGLATTFGPGGRVEAEEPYVDGGRDGLASYYFADGRPRAQIMWRAGKPDGPWVEYFPEGGIKSRRDMREGEVDGWYETYGPDGLPAERRFFRRGEEAPPSAEADAAVRHYRERFAAVIDRTVGGVTKLAGQLTQWLANSSRDDTGD